MFACWRGVGSGRADQVETGSLEVTRVLPSRATPPMRALRGIME